MEMRRELRYRLDVPVLFSWGSAHQKRLQGEGITRDISVLSAYIVTPTSPPVDALVQVEVVLPSLAGMTSMIRIQGDARVIRVDHPARSQGENGFAVVREGSNQWSLGKVPNGVESGLFIDSRKTQKAREEWVFRPNLSVKIFPA